MTASKEAMNPPLPPNLSKDRREIHSVRVRRQELKKTYDEELAHTRAKVLDSEIVRAEMGPNKWTRELVEEKIKSVLKVIDEMKEQYIKNYEKIVKQRN
jgi:hypothetical protein